MLSTHPNLIPLWDYGWCEHRIIELPQTPQTTEIPHAYLQCQEFGTSFVFPEPGDNPDLQGPFQRSAILPSHFKSVSTQTVLPAIKTICFDLPDIKPVSLEQWQELESLICSVLQRNSLAFELVITTENTELQHDWGWVLLEFREFLFGNPGSNQIERLAIGYD